MSESTTDESNKKAVEDGLVKILELVLSRYMPSTRNLGEEAILSVKVSPNFFHHVIQTCGEFWTTTRGQERALEENTVLADMNRIYNN